MFKLRPYRSLLLGALLVGIIGGLLSAYFFIEDAYDSTNHRAWLVLILTFVIIVFLVVAAYSRYGFKHLRHHRPGYKHG